MLTSIPQGDPFSMMVVALVLRPWVLEMRSYAVKPRKLADDLQILATGPNHLRLFQLAFDKTHEHLEAMGARIAPTKPIVFSPNKTASNWLEDYKWRRTGTTIKVISNCRDAGAHLCISRKRSTGGTLTKRYKKGTGFAKK